MIAEVSRVLKPGGLGFYHTFNRNFLAYLVVIKLVEWLIKNTPKIMHILKLFLKPKEVASYCEIHGMQVQEVIGIRPRFSTVTLKHLISRSVPENFSFSFTPSLKLSYMGYAQKLSK